MGEIHRENENIKEEKILRVGEKELKLQDHVTIVRASGGIEKDWILVDFDNEEVQVMRYVERDEKGNLERLRKTVPLKDFIEWQSEEK